MFPIVAMALALQLALSQPTDIESRMLDLTNMDRAATGLAPLRGDEWTLPIARERAEQQSSRDVPLTHLDSSGFTFIRLLSQARVYLFTGYAGENLARSYPVEPLEKIEAALLASPTHRANILSSDWTYVSVGVWEDPTTPGIDLAFIYR